MEAEARDRRELEDDMRKAIARNEFELHYQTIVDVGRRRSAAAPRRWCAGATRSAASFRPTSSSPLAEESGLIVPLGDWILRKACADAVKWPPHLKVAVNLSPAQFKQSDLLGVLRSALDDTGLRAAAGWSSKSPKPC